MATFVAGNIPASCHPKVRDLVDVCPETRGFTFRLMGTALAKLFERYHTGLPF